jgi:hypothetical protein
MAGTFLFGLALLASQHLRHLAGVLPYLLLLTCPLMHFFGHGHHSHQQADTPSRKLPNEPQGEEPAHF